MPTLNHIAKQQEAAMLKAFRDSLRGIRDSARLNDITRALEAGNISTAIDLLGLDRAAFEPLENAIRDSYRTGGITGASQVGRIPVEGGSIVTRFDMSNPRAEQWLSTNSSGLIVEIVEDQRIMAQQVLTRGLEAGRNPRSVGLDMVGRIDPRTGLRTGGFVGLTTDQAGWVDNARGQLESLDPAYFNRTLRDQRFDPTIRKAIESGQPLTQEQIGRITTQYQAKAQQYRGEVIARTESINALRAGQHESIMQAIDESELAAQDLTETWDSTMDGRTRESHIAAEGQTVRAGEPFIIGGFPMRYPGDSSMGAPAEEVIQCRCRVRYQIDFGAQLKRVEGFR
jgi:hypothetical protein